MPRSPTPQIAALGFNVQDVRDIGLKGYPDTEVMEAASNSDAVIIIRDRGFANIAVAISIRTFWWGSGAAPPKAYRTGGVK